MSYDPFIKRLFDFLFSAIALFIVSPIIVFCGLMVLLSSPGPVFFKQERVGRFGRSFNVLKLRTMANAMPGANDPQITIGRDSRITPIGHFLRSWKIDELPQLWNVLIGDMSLVGPRPEVLKYVKLYEPSMRDLILSVRPGITDPCSIYLKNESELIAESENPEVFYTDTLLPLKQKMSSEYILNRSIISDMGIICQTILAITGFSKGARGSTDRLKIIKDSNKLQ